MHASKFERPHAIWKIENCSERQLLQIEASAIANVVILEELRALFRKFGGDVPGA